MNAELKYPFLNKISTFRGRSDLGQYRWCTRCSLTEECMESCGRKMRWTKQKFIKKGQFSLFILWLSNEGKKICFLFDSFGQQINYEKNNEQAGLHTLQSIKIIWSGKLSRLCSRCLNQRNPEDPNALILNTYLKSYAQT